MQMSRKLYFYMRFCIIQIMGSPTIAMAETQSGGMREKEDVAVNALAAEVADTIHTSTQGVKMALKVRRPSEFYQEYTARVLSPILEETSTENFEKSRKPRQKKNKSNTTKQALQMQPADINGVLSKAHEQLQVHNIQELSTGKINPHEKIKPFASSAKTDDIDATPNKNPMVAVLPVNSEEVKAYSPGKPKKPRKPRRKKNTNYSSTTEQSLEMQSANVHRVLSRAEEELRAHFIQESSTSEINPPKNIKLIPSAEQGVANANQDPMTQVQSVIKEEVSTFIPRKPKTRKKPRNKKNKISSKTLNPVLQMQPADINKASSSSDKGMKLHSIQELSTRKIGPEKIKTTIPSAQTDPVPVLDVDSCENYEAQILPVITEETSADNREKTKKKKKSKQKKNNNKPSTVEQTLQMQTANINGASSSVKEIQPYQIQEPSMSNVDLPGCFKTPTATGAINYAKNEINQISKTGKQTKNALAVGESKKYGQKNDKENNNISDLGTNKMFLSTKKVTKVDEKPQTSKDATQETAKKADRGAETPVQMYYFLPIKAVAKHQKPHASKDALKEPDEKPDGAAKTQKPSHLLFFREHYDHSGRLCIRPADEGKLYIDGLYSQEKLASLDPSIRIKIGKAIHSIMIDVTVDFKDFCLPINKLEIIYNRLHNIIFMRLYKIGFTELASIELNDILAIYRVHFSRAADIQFLHAIL